ncbi:MAG: bifunctional glutamate N-acetyltransferase/amino-acid acetyltransferase ArgJ [Pseudomonadota bacterium]
MAVAIAPPSALLTVPGVRLATAAARVKAHAAAADAESPRDDLTLIDLAPGSTVAGVFTQSHFAAPPVQLCRELLAAGQSVRGLVINSGNANAATGPAGRSNALSVCSAAARALGIGEPEAAAVGLPPVLPFSTGVIGEHLPVARMTTALDGLSKKLAPDRWDAAARAIMTTDTVPKAASTQVDLAGVQVTLTGMAKGSGMIEPNMATMLAFIACDAAVAAPVLQQVCERVAERSFNRVTVDGDTSTNDSFVLIATGAAEAPPIEDADAPELEPLEQALTALAVKLAQDIARDGEGATRFVTINVSGATDDDACLAVARTLAISPLLKTAIFAGDPNWGRLCMAIGRAPVAIDPDAVEVYLASTAGRVCVARAGMVADEYLEADAAAVMAEPELTIDVKVGECPTRQTVWTCDYSYEYVKINAEYRT